ncbi:tRNA-dihydrouridine synthase [Silvimonas sp.]|uniref:tRNA dihydrouridine synthase n=1 Tax=Silvimonas sp. TaxID=2650811 RepID=UPI002844BB89|nr:tRNA-dihydrouridine synthase [Silvimonas sp.]MDR3428710.1 tRNA-dihydrouridine synthase [Silvimonas sp.]
MHRTSTVASRWPGLASLAALSKQAGPGYNGGCYFDWLPALRIYLAPMEGLLDHVLRDVLTRAGGVDLCVSEFIRVSGSLLPKRIFYRFVPELLNGGKTPAGVPVRVQLLGSDPACMAENAERLASLNPPGIDLNFGCPAKTVNRHGGGALLLKTPEVIHEVVSAVRRAVPAHIPVTTKMRLGYEDQSLTLECAHAMQDGGSAELVVHARTKTDGYRPPAYWEKLPAIREALSIPVIANGEIWTAADFHRCREVSGCEDVMIGRGMVANPGLALQALSQAGLAWSDLAPLVQLFWHNVESRILPKYQAGRAKQWLGYLRRTYPQADAVFIEGRALQEGKDLVALMLDSMRAEAAVLV